jgi:transposase
MRDIELCCHLSGLIAPWELSGVELSVDGGRVDAWAEHPRRSRFACSECGTELAVYDHAEERSWRYLDSRAFLTYLHARPPHVCRRTHGVRQVTLAWAEPMSRFGVLFERLAVDVLRECNVEGAGRLLRPSWDDAWQLMERAVARGLT